MATEYTKKELITLFNKPVLREARVIHYDEFTTMTHPRLCTSEVFTSRSKHPTIVIREESQQQHFWS